MEFKIFEEEGKVIGFLRLLNGTRIDLSYNKSSRIVLLGFEDYVLRMSFKEFKEFVRALAKYIKYI